MNRVKVSLNQNYDVVVVGGGIHGVGVAQASAAQGYSVLLLEQNEIASATSQKSSKLIHGGLRYLETAQFSLVRECLAERRFLLKNAPHLVKMKPFFLPIYRQTTRRPLQIRLGLSIYAALDGFDSKSRFKRVHRADWDNLDGLTTTDLECVYQYWDAQTDDKKLTKAVLKSAQNLGAESAEFTSLHKASHNGQCWEIQASSNDEVHEINAKVLVNASGPWVNEILKRVSPTEKGVSIDLVQGAHIILDEETTRGIYYVESPQDQRAIFVMPWYGKTLVGTTESLYRGDPSKVKPKNEELVYLLSTIQHYFPKYHHYDIKDISQSFAGLRVLPKQDRMAFSRPRETTIHTDLSGRCFSIYGGKLTAYRATSQRVLAHIKKIVVGKGQKANTRTLALTD